MFSFTVNINCLLVFISIRGVHWYIRENYLPINAMKNTPIIVSEKKKIYSISLKLERSTQNISRWIHNNSRFVYSKTSRSVFLSSHFIIDSVSVGREKGTVLIGLYNFNEVLGTRLLYFSTHKGVFG